MEFPSPLINNGIGDTFMNTNIKKGFKDQAIIVETTELYFCFVNNFSKMSVILNIYEHILYIISCLLSYLHTDE